MSDIFDGKEDPKQNIKMKGDEINGEKHLFHSLPKEFQEWHSNYYILERAGNLNTETIAKGTFNAYLWKVLFDGTSYGIYAFMMIVTSIILTRIYPNILISVVDFIFSLGMSIYFAYHFYFYGIIRAQVVGAITAKAAYYTSITFYNTVTAVFFSLITAFLFFIFILEDLLELLYRVLLTIKLSGNLDFITQAIYNAGVIIHNLFVLFLYAETSIFDNIYFVIFYMSLILIFLSVLMETIAYRKTRKEIIAAYSFFDLDDKFPIEKSQKVITTWRKKHEM